MRAGPSLLFVGLLAIAEPATAQQIVTSTGPQALSVTIYRAPNREPEAAIDRTAPEGYALITETRTVTLPAGRATLRFEGVAGNIFPESAIVSGLPSGVREKNLDADLLSARSLYDRALGRRVVIRRTDKGSGRVVEQQAVVRSGADGAAVLQTADGFETLRCTGWKETLVYDGVPPGLSPKPTLSIETDSATPVTATITLSYLAGGFDWQADYVMRMRPDGRSADLFAWVTLASSDVTSFPAAGTQVIAGKPNRESTPSFGNFDGGALDLKCWSEAVYGRPIPQAYAMAPPPPPPAPMMMSARAEAMDVVVTGSRKVAQEAVGDFKLYRIPDPVTVASKAQKQVALLEQSSVPFAAVHVSEIAWDGAADPVLTLRAKNRSTSGLGLPLPAGKVAVFEEAGGRPILVGESATDDKAIGEDVEFKLGGTPGVRATFEPISRTRKSVRYRLVVTNANPRPIAYEAKIDAGAGPITAATARLGKRDGKAIWSVQVPANGTATLSYTQTAL